MTAVELLAANMTASGPSLREWVTTRFGRDPLRDPRFQWSNDLPCDDCRIADSTAVITGRRLCYHCATDQ